MRIIQLLKQVSIQFQLYEKTRVSVFFYGEIQTAGRNFVLHNEENNDIII